MIKYLLGHKNIIHVFIQGPLRTPKTPFLKGKMWLEIGASAGQAL